MYGHRENVQMQCMKFLCIISSCPAGARKWHISYVAMLLHSKKDFRSNAEVLF